MLNKIKNKLKTIEFSTKLATTILFLKVIILYFILREVMFITLKLTTTYIEKIEPYNKNLQIIINGTETNYNQITNLLNTFIELGLITIILYQIFKLFFSTQENILAKTTKSLIIFIIKCLVLMTTVSFTPYILTHSEIINTIFEYIVGRLFILALIILIIRQFIKVLRRQLIKDIGVTQIIDNWTKNVLIPLVKENGNHYYIATNYNTNNKLIQITLSNMAYRVKYDARECNNDSSTEQTIKIPYATYNIYFMGIKI